MTMYNYLTSCYGISTIAPIFDTLQLNRSKPMPTRGLRGTGNTTLTAIEAYLNKHHVISKSTYEALSTSILSDEYFLTTIILDTDDEVTEVEKLTNELANNLGISFNAAKECLLFDRDRYMYRKETPNIRCVVTANPRYPQINKLVCFDSKFPEELLPITNEDEEATDWFLNEEIV